MVQAWSASWLVLTVGFSGGHKSGDEGRNWRWTVVVANLQLTTNVGGDHKSSDEEKSGEWTVMAAYLLLTASGLWLTSSEGRMVVVLVKQGERKKEPLIWMINNLMWETNT